MFRRQFSLLPAAAVLLLIALLVGPVSSGNDSRPDFTGWYTGADGMVEAMKVRNVERQTMFLYFYTDWCPYCRQFERELLSESEVDQYMDSILAVRVNPEAGEVEREIAMRYGVRGYPAIYLHSGSSDVVSMVERMRLVDGQPQLKEAAAFVEHLKKAAAR